MKIELHEISVSEVVAGYKDSAEEGVVGFGGHLNIRPSFQREFIYKDKQRNEVINTIRYNFPLNVMYWVKSDDGNYELMDGQQRTLSICQYINGEYSISYQYFHNLTEDEQQQILNYNLMVYICTGDKKEKLDWFRIINIAGEELADQELRNAIYTGEWLTDAKRYFSKTDCPAYNIAGDYLKGSAIRQDYLETVIGWIAAKNEQEIDDYMAAHQHNPNANKLWLYFNAVMNWVVAVFPVYRRIMKGVEWGILYNRLGGEDYDAKALEQQIVALLGDEDVTKVSGIYAYVLDGNERHLNIRKFSDRMKAAAYEAQKGICVSCGEHFELEGMEADHITPWSEGGKTVPENCQLLCKACNRTKSNS